MNIASFLTSVGLEQKEQKAYLALLALGDAETSRIARKAGLKRSTAYSILEKLVGMGLASEYREGYIKRFVAENPKKIRSMLEGRIAVFESCMPEFEKLYTVAAAEAKIRFFEGAEGMRAIADETLDNREKQILSIGSASNVKEAMGTSIKYAKRRSEKKIFSRNLRIKGEAMKSDYLKNQVSELREVRFLPEDMHIPVMLSIWDRKVCGITSRQEGFGFIIESKEFSDTLRSVFEALWKISEKTN